LTTGISALWLLRPTINLQNGHDIFVLLLLLSPRLRSSAVKPTPPAARSRQPRHAPPPPSGDRANRATTITMRARRAISRFAFVSFSITGRLVVRVQLPLVKHGRSLGVSKTLFRPSGNPTTHQPSPAPRVLPLVVKL
jgi:hypothetical protein